MNRHSKRLLALAALAVAAAGAQAAVVTFEPADFTFVFPADPVYSIEGFDFALRPGNSEAFLAPGLLDPDNYVGNGTKNLFAANYASVNVAASNGAAFGLNSFELGGSFIDEAARSHWASSVQVVGRTVDGFTLNAQFALPTTTTMTLVTLNWSNLASFEILPNPHAGSVFNDRDFTIDNINVTTAVPEPESLALMLAGLAALAFIRTRRRV